MTADLHAAALAALEARRALIEAGTPGPWRVGDNQLVAGCLTPGRCAYCHTGEPTWAGRQSINGKVMQVHIHEDADPWPHGIYAERRDGNAIVVNDTDEYGYTDAADAALIVAAVNAFAADTDALQQVLVRHREFRIYDECDHNHEADDPAAVNVYEVGITCEDAYLYSICRGCCTEDVFQTEECVGYHKHPCYPCPDARSVLAALGLEA